MLSKPDAIKCSHPAARSLKGFNIFLQFLLILLFSIMASSPCMAAPGNDGPVRAFFMSIYNFSFPEADSLLSGMTDANTGKANIMLLRADLAWWRLLSGDDEKTNIKLCSENIDESLRISLKDDNPSPDALFNIIYSYSLKMRLENLRGNSLGAFINFCKSASFIERCRELADSDERMTLILGLYNYSVSYLHNNYFLLNALLFSLPAGDRVKGLAYLTRCTESQDEIIRTEAVYFLMKIYGSAEKDYSRALEYSVRLTGRYPGNFVYAMEEMRLLTALKEKDKAISFGRELMKKISGAPKLSSSQKNHLLTLVESQVNENSKTRPR